MISIRFGAFLKVKIQFWKMCLGLLNLKFFLGMPDIPYIFGRRRKRVDAGTSLRI